MPTFPGTSQDGPGALRILPLGIGVLAGPLLWLLTLQVGSALLASSCQTADRPKLLTILFLALLLTAGGGALAWREWKQLRALPATNLSEENAPRSWARFAAVLGLAASASFAILLIGTALPILLLDPCG